MVGGPIEAGWIAIYIYPTGHDGSVVARAITQSEFPTLAPAGIVPPAKKVPKETFMSNESILMLHPTFGILAIIATVWVFVETLNASEKNAGRIGNAGVLAAILMWLAYIVGGYWYVVHYGGDKAIIKAGPWPVAHSFFMETKEHVFLMLLLLTTFLAILVRGDVVKATRNLVLWVSGLVVLMGLAMEGAGAFISMGVKVALLAK